MRHSHSSEQNPPKLSKSGTISTDNAESVASRVLAPHEYTSINSTTHAAICKSATAVLSSFVDGLHFVAAYKDFNLWCSFRCLKNASSGPRRVWKQQCRVYRRGKGYEKLPAFVTAEACLFSPEQQKNCMSNAIARGMMLQMRSMSPSCKSCTLVMQTVEFVQAIHLHCNSSSFKTPSSSVFHILQEMLILQRIQLEERGTLNSKGVCITDSEVLDELKAKEEEKMEKQRMKSERKEQKKAKSLETERRKAEAEQKRKTKEIQRNKREE